MAETRSSILTFSSEPSDFNTFRSSETTTLQSLKWLVLRLTRSLARRSTSFSAARFSTWILRPSQSSWRRHCPTVWGFNRSRRAISALLLDSPVRKSRRASSRTLLGALAIRVSFNEMPSQVGEAPRLAIPSSDAVAGQLHRLLDELLLLRGDHERHHPRKDLLCFLSLLLEEGGDIFCGELKQG